MRWSWLAFVALFGLCSCAYYTLVQPPTREIGGAYRVDPQIAWSARSQGKVEIWTVNGTMLEALRLYAKLSSEETLLPGRRSAERELPSYKPGMRAHDVADLVTGTIEASGGTDVEVRDLRPAQFGRWSGFRFELEYYGGEGLAYRGIALGAIDDRERLHLILYTAAKEHYFDEYRDEVERLLGSVESI